MLAALHSQETISKGHIRVTDFDQEPAGSPFMKDPKDPDEQRNWMVDLWHRCGEHYNVFMSEEQPAPTIWESALPDPEEKGRAHPGW